jgi:hypothetical protein
MAILLKAIYRFHAIPIKSQGYSSQKYKNHLETQKSLIGKAISSKRNNARALTITLQSQ